MTRCDVDDEENIVYTSAYGLDYMSSMRTWTHRSCALSANSLLLLLLGSKRIRDCRYSYLFYALSINLVMSYL